MGCPKCDSGVGTAAASVREQKRSRAEARSPSPRSRGAATQEPVTRSPAVQRSSGGVAEDTTGGTRLGTFRIIGCASGGRDAAASGQRRFHQPVNLARFKRRGAIVGRAG